MTADTAAPDTIGAGALPDEWHADRSAIEDTLAALAALPDLSPSIPPAEPRTTGSTPPSAQTPAAPLPTRRSLREAAGQRRSGTPHGRAGLFSRVLTVKAFRTRNSEGGRRNRADGLVAELLASASAHGVVGLRHRRIPGQRGTVQHLAIGPSGVFVIEVLQARKASVEGRLREGASSSDLLVDGQDMTTAVTATVRRVEAVGAVLVGAGLGDVPVTGVLCVVDGLLPLGISDLEVRGVHVVAPTTLTSLVSRPGLLDPEHRLTLQEFFAEQLPSAA